jgi:hypothetical protein
VTASVCACVAGLELELDVRLTGLDWTELIVGVRRIFFPHLFYSLLIT